jgi:hypothetical protein
VDDAIAQFLADPAVSAFVATAGVALTALIELIGLTRRTRLRRKLEDGSRAMEFAGRPLPELEKLASGWAVEVAGRLIRPTVSASSASLLTYFAAVVGIALYIRLGFWDPPDDSPFWFTVGVWMTSVLAVVFASGPSAVLFSISSDVAARARWFADAGYRKLATEDKDFATSMVWLAWLSLLLPALALSLLVARIFDLVVSIDPSSVWFPSVLILVGSALACVIAAIVRDKKGRERRAEAKIAVKRAPAEVPPFEAVSRAAESQPHRASTLLLGVGLGAVAAWWIRSRRG